MDRAAVTLGTPDSRAGIMDGSVIGTNRIGKESDRNSSLGVDRIGRTLSQHPSSGFQTEAEKTGEEVVLDRLWFELPLDEQAQFGNCFCRMLLKCLIDTAQDEQEVLQ